jgi:uncharacterized membrane protein
VPSYLSRQLVNVSPDLSVLLALAAAILQMGLALGLIGLTLKANEGLKPPAMELFNYFQFLWKYFLASLLYGLIILLGFILLIVPGLIWAVKYNLFAFFIIDKGVRPLESLQLSAQATAGKRWQLFVFLLLLVLINTVGALLYGVGLLLTVPITYIAWAHIYKALSAGVPLPVSSLTS